MRKIGRSLLLSGALLLGACGGPTVQDSANQAGTAIADPTTVSAVNEAATALADPTNMAAVDEAANQAGTAIADPTAAALINEAATAVTGPDAATAVADAANALTAAADDVTLKQGEALVLDATKSAGEITDYKWTIEKAPAGAESVVGQTIMEGSSGNVSLEPNDYAKYFPKPGEYTVRLTVTGPAGATTYDDFEISVP